MEFNISPGLSSTIETIVENKDLAVNFGSGSVEVLSTPRLVALMEKAAMSSVDLHLPSNCATVGTKVNISHIAATPLGMKIKINARLVEVNGRRLKFEVEAYDEKEKICEGYHERFIVESDKFYNKAVNKLHEYKGDQNAK